MLERLIVFVEEESAEAALETLLPKLLPETSIQIIKFQGKQNLLSNLPTRLRGFQWLPEQSLLLVLVDRDDDACVDLKQQLEDIARDAGFTTKSSVPPGQPFRVLNRIVIEELESWYFGDWQAVCEAYPKMPSTVPHKSGYRDPDAIAGGTWEALERILQRYGYFESGLAKIKLARDVASRMNPERNTSRSFQSFRNAIVAASQLES